MKETYTFFPQSTGMQGKHGYALQAYLLNGFPLVLAYTTLRAAFRGEDALAAAFRDLGKRDA